MTADVLGGRVDRHVTAMFERREEGRPPRVIDDHLDVTRVRASRNRRNIHHLERERGWRFHQHYLRVGLDEPCKIVRARRRREVRRLHAEPRQKSVAERACWIVHGVRDEQMVSTPHKGEQRRVAGGDAGRGDAGVITALNGGKCFLERKCGRVSMTAIPHASERPVRRSLAVRAHGRERDCRHVVYRWVDHTALEWVRRPFILMTSCVYDLGVCVQMRQCFAFT